jgi:hypothetical protein
MTTFDYISGDELMKILDAPVYSQRDPQWATQHYGLPQAIRSSTIGAFGCAITCIAQKLTLLGFPTTPLQVQAALAAKRGFRAGGTWNFVDWTRVPVVFPQLKYIGRHDMPGNSPTPKRIMDLIMLRMQLNDPVIVYVDAQRYVGGLQQHFVLVVGQMQSGTLSIANPWTGSVQDLRAYHDTDDRAIRGVIMLDQNVDSGKAF